MVVSKYYDELPSQVPYVIDPKSGTYYEELGERGDNFDDWKIVRTSDLGVAWTRADPGAEVDWHSHAPDFYQIHVVLKGTIRWYYKDNDGEERYVEASEGEAVYLPGGSENKIEVVGDEEHEKIVITPQLHLTRMEYALKEGGYRRKSAYSREAALVYDNVNDREVHVEEDAIVNLEEVRERKGENQEKSAEED